MSKQHDCQISKGTKFTVATLIQALQGKNAGVRAAAYALNRAGTQAWQAIPHLIQPLSNEDAWVREEAAKALSVISEQDFGDAPAVWQTWWQTQP